MFRRFSSGFAWTRTGVRRAHQHGPIFPLLLQIHVAGHQLSVFLYITKEVSHNAEKRVRRTRHCCLGVCGGARRVAVSIRVGGRFALVDGSLQRIAAPVLEKIVEVKELYL